MKLKIKIKVLMAVFFSMLLFIPAAVMADSAFFNPNPSYQANDVVTDAYFVGFNISGDNVYGWEQGNAGGYNNGTVKLYSKSTGGLIADYGKPTAYAAAQTIYNSFVKVDSSDGSLWAGWTIGGNTDDRIYRYDLTTGNWSHEATLNGNFDMEFYGGNAYVSGLNASGWGNPNSIWLLDTSGNNAHDKIVEMSGSSAGIAFDNDGNAYYAQYGSTGLYKWDANDIAGATGAGYLTYADGTKLSDIEHGAYDIETDDAGNIVFNMNGGGDNLVAIWDGTEWVQGEGDEQYNYDVMGGSINSGWFSLMDAEGDVTDGTGSVWQENYGSMGLAEISAVPIPGAIWLLGSGLIALVGIRKKTRI